MNEPVKPKWYSGKYIVDELKKEGFELFDLMNAGVQVITKGKKKVVDRDPLLKKRYTLDYLEENEWKIELLRRGTEETGKVITGRHGVGYNRTERTQLSRTDTDKIALREWEKLPKIFFDDLEGCKSISFILPDDDIGCVKAILEAKTFLFLAVDVDKFFANENNIQDETAYPRKRPEQEGKEKPLKETENYFHREGNGWRIGFQGEKATFVDYKYIRYIVYLLEKQGKSIGAINLVHAADNSTKDIDYISKKQAFEDGLSVDRTYKDAEISNKKLREFEERLAELNRETDPLVKAELQKQFNIEMEKLRRMNALVNKKGKKAHPPKRQRLDDPHRKNAQKSVKKALDTAYSAFTKANLKKLAKHLEENIKPDGYYDFSYRNVDVSWDIK